MPEKQISPTATTSNHLSNCPHALETHFTYSHHLGNPFEHSPCPEYIFHPVPSPQNPIFNCPDAAETHFTHCHHLKTHFQLLPCHQSTGHKVTSPQTPFSTASMPLKHISPTAIASKPLFNCPHAFKSLFTECHHLKPPFQLPPCSQKTVGPLQPPQNAVSNAALPSKHISPAANTSNPLFKCAHVLKTDFT